MPSVIRKGVLLLVKFVSRTLNLERWGCQTLFIDLCVGTSAFFSGKACDSEIHYY